MPRHFALALLLLALPVASVAGQSVAQRSKGSANAPVTVYEMSDFQCPFCHRFAIETFPVIEREYISTGKVRWVFINLPITQLHPNAVPAAEFAMCAARQDKFWPTHDWLYESQPAWQDLDDTGAFFTGRIQALSLDRQKLMDCLTRGETLPLIRQDAEGAARSGARSTPSFYIEGGMLTGAQPLAVFRQVLDSIVAAKSK